MKIFSEPKVWTMKADRWGRMLFNVLTSAMSAFIVSLAIPPGDLAQAVFGIMFVIIAVGMDLRDRALEIFKQNEELLRRTHYLGHES